MSSILTDQPIPSPAARLLLIACVTGCQMLFWAELFGFFPRSLRRTPWVRVAAAQTQISNFSRAVRLFERDCGRPPTSTEGLEALLSPSRRPRGWRGPYLQYTTIVPLDPWKHRYVYRLSGPVGSGWTVVCWGADGRPGGSGLDADLTIAAGWQWSAQ